MKNVSLSAGPGDIIAVVGLGKVIGSAGPTTSGRMDAYAPALIERGLKGMIGKGSRSDKVKEYCRKHGAVYFAATGGDLYIEGRKKLPDNGVVNRDAIVTCP